MPSRKISGFIIDVKTIGPMKNNEKQIHVQTTGTPPESLILHLRGFYPTRVGDIITGVIDTDLMTFSQAPHITLSSNKQSILNCIANFRMKGVPVHTWEHIYQTLFKEVGGQQEVVNTLTNWAYTFQETRSINASIPVHFRKRLTESNWKKFLTMWFNQYALRNLYLLGLTKKEIFGSKIQPDQLHEQCLKNPWAVPCIPLEKCELIDSRLGRKPTDVQRKCGKVLRHVFSRTALDIHTYASYDDLIKLFPWVGEEKWQKKLDEEYALVFKDTESCGRVYYRPIFCMELYVAERLYEMLTRPMPPVIEPIWPDDISLTDEQKLAVETALNTNICIITGRGGTGKTLISKVCVMNDELHHVDYILTSFTGKAVARIKEVVKKPAWTLDQFMTLGDEDFTRVYIDETSMVTLELLYRFMKRFENVKFRLCLIGDIFQLPPIGFGYVLRELMKVKQIPQVHLTLNHRILDDDVENHGVMRACQSVLDAPHPPCDLEECETFSITYGDEDTVVELFEFLKENGLTQDDVICITPYKDCVKRLNPKVSAVFHPDAVMVDPETTIGHTPWRVGDSVMMLANCYEIEVFNGEIGTVTNMDETHLYVKFGIKEVAFVHKREEGEEDEEGDFDWDDMEAEVDGKEKRLSVKVLSQAYAITVHKAQGSEWKYVICYFPFIATKSLFICKELVYTMFSRAQTAVYLILPTDRKSLLERQVAKSSKETRLDYVAGLLEELIEENTDGVDEVEDGQEGEAEDEIENEDNKNVDAE